ncbi:Synaptic vesicle 2-related protein [Seminavis robusta]|uniref:Synaptic vesicle 2-related protein n=1 Tax=Seminavis robusta TaxID=568900 RepID=A0A9N8E9Q2_9STRA|nr:Synaptic vesicle 2-related protein [Seminavis robusta]|eukprot:Sro811_g205940.1 Synaptic vesicle 2-related protein (546) ;mRNA; f:32260-33897
MSPKLKDDEEQSLLATTNDGHHYGSSAAATTNNDTNDTDDAIVILSLTMDDAMDRLGFGTFQYRLVWAAGLCVMADGLEILLLSVLTVVLRAEWNLLEWQASLLMSSVFCGALLGSLVLGQLADHYGRKPIFILTAAIIALLGVLTGFATTFHWLILCRWGVGFGVGGGTVPFDTLIEFLPRSQRGHHMLYIWFFWTIGTMLVVVLAYFTVGESSSSNHENEEATFYWEGWRLFVIACAIPCISSMVLGILWVPESPRWLLTTQNDPEQALAVLRGAAVVNGKDPNLLFPLGRTKLLAEEYHNTDHNSTNNKLSQRAPEEAHFWDLFRPKWLRTTLYLFGTWVGFAFLYYGGVIVTTLVFASSTASSNNNTQEDNAGTYHFEYGALFVANAAEIVATIFMIHTVEKLGRIPIQTYGFLSGGIMVVLLCGLTSLHRQQQQAEQGEYATYTYLAMVVLAFGVRMANMAASCTTWVSTAEIFTTDIRSTGHSAANAVARLGGFLVPYVVSAEAPLTFIGASMMCVAVGTAFCASRLPETKGKELGVID